jgi:PAS domain S-box-containing protein
MSGPPGELERLRRELAAAAADRDRLAAELDRTRSELAAARSHVREVEALRSRMIETTPDCIKILSLDATVEWLSDSARDLFELDDLGAVVGMPWLDFWKDEHHDAAAAAVEAARAGTSGRFEGFCPTLKGKPRWWSVVVAPIEGPSGRPERLFAVTRDISTLKSQEAELRKRVELEQLFVATIGHELRNPLNAIVNQASALLEQCALPPQAAKALPAILWAGERAARLISNLLSYSELHLHGAVPLLRRPCDLGALAARVVDEVHAVLPGRHIEVWRDGDLVGPFDDVRLAQILGNLISNAVVHSPPGTPIAIRIAGRGGRVSIEVENGGPPIPGEDLAMLFEPLRRGEASAARARDGLGLGLFVCRALSEAHGGTIAVRSTPGATVFAVDLPLG